MPPAVVRRAGPADLDAVAPLFDAYRRFYGQPADPVLARAFLVERLARGESAVFVAEVAGVAAGFAQLYPLFSSVAARKVWLLNDLYAAPDFRRLGVGRALLDAVRRFAAESEALRVELETAPDNAAARRLYEAAGYRLSEGFLRYTLELRGGASGRPRRES